MKRLNTLIVGLAVIALTGGAAVAKDKMAAGMNKDGMASGSMKMSKRDTATMKSCQAMSHDKMMMARKCKTLMAKHADMFNADGTMKDMAAH